MNRHRTIRMEPNQVNSHNEQHLRNTVYNYQRLEPSSRATSAATLVKSGQQPLKLQRRSAKFKVGDYVYLI